MPVANPVALLGDQGVLGAGAAGVGDRDVPAGVARMLIGAQRAAHMRHFHCGVLPQA